MTDVFGIIGYPVGHSLSPAMHNSAFRKINHNGVYVPFEVRPDNFERAVEGMIALGVRGVNVTIPYKERIIDFFRREREVEEIGAANTVHLERNKCYNTDVNGVIQAIRNAGIEPEGMRILVAGAGGASRACVYALKNRNEVCITNRTVKRGMEIAERFGIEFVHPDKVSAKEFDMIVNATPLGMKGFPEKLPVPEKLLRNRPVVFDMVYNPPETPLIRAGRKYGCLTVSGVEMLVFQGARAFEIFTGKKAPVEVMREAVISELKKLI